VPGDLYSYEGWIDPTPSDRSAFDVPIAQSESFTLKAQEQGPFAIGHSRLPPGVQCIDAASPGNPAQVDCTVSPTFVGVSPVSFFDALNPSRIVIRTFVVGRGAYTAQGDSFSSADGIPQFIPPSDSDKCNRSYVAYPETVAKTPYGGDVRFVACSGATIPDVVAGKSTEESQLLSLDRGVDLVTITVGGDDIHFADIATFCVIVTTGCEFRFSSQATQDINRIGNEANAGIIFSPGDRSLRNELYTLDNMYATIHQYAPNARILVVGYPNLLPAIPIVDCPQDRLSKDEIDWLNSVEAYLNQTIAFEAARNRRRVRSRLDDRLHRPRAVHCSAIRERPRAAGTWQGALSSQRIGPERYGGAGHKTRSPPAPRARSFLSASAKPYTTSATVASGMAQATFSTSWPGSDVVMTLVSPSGRVITRSTASSDVYHLLGPTYEVFSIASPEPGSWTMTMQGAQVSADGETVLLNTAQLPHVNAPPIASFTTSVTNGTAPLRVGFDATASNGP